MQQSLFFGRILVVVYFWQDTCSSVFVAGYATVQRAGVGGTGGGYQALVLWEGARLRNQVRRCPTHRTPCPTYTRPINKKKVQRGGDAGVGGSCKDPTVRCSARRGLVSLFIHHIHSHKIRHRDVKSENIFLDARGNCKLGNLGVAKVLSTQVDFARTLVVRRTSFDSEENKYIYIYIYIN